jgi:hypothetical protein
MKHLKMAKVYCFQLSFPVFNSSPRRGIGQGEGQVQVILQGITSLIKREISIEIQSKENFSQIPVLRQNCPL